MLIVCPSCATSYMIDQAAVGPAGRNVRCARCKATWFAGGPKAAPDVTAFVDSVIAEAEERPARPARTEQPPPAAKPAPVQQCHAGRRFRRRRSRNDRRNRPCAPRRGAGAGAGRIAGCRTRHRSSTRRRWCRRSSTIRCRKSTAPSSIGEEEESFAVRRQRLQGRRKQTRRSSRWTAAILVLVAFNVALVGARNEVVRYLPQTASLFAAIGLPVNLRHLKFENVKISKETQDGINLLIVQGSIVSEAGKPVEVPRLRFAARNKTGQEIYTWTMPPPRSILGPGERIDFRSQIPAPPADASDVMVRFFTAQDAGGK